MDINTNYLLMILFGLLIMCQDPEIPRYVKTVTWVALIVIGVVLAFVVRQ